MKIKSIEVFSENMLLKRPYKIAYKMVDSVENIILKLTLENGMVGWGSSNISSYVVHQTNDDTLRICNGGSLDFIIGRDIQLFSGLIREIDDRFRLDIGVRVMLDIAIHDAFTQFLGVSLCDFLGRRHQSLPTSVTIGIMDVEETIDEARNFISNGFRCLKIKLGHSIHEDINRLIKLREIFGDELFIRVDANQGWTRQETIQFFEATKHLDIELIEQPVQVNKLDQLRDLPNSYRRKIAADESLKNAGDAQILSKHPSPVGIFNIKFMKCGGITESLRIADIARDHKIDLMWGCNDESIISISAALHTAFACPHTKYLDLDGSLDLAKDVVQGGFIIESGCMRTMDLPGLGLQALEKYF